MKFVNSHLIGLVFVAYCVVPSTAIWAVQESIEQSGEVWSESQEITWINTDSEPIGYNDGSYQKSSCIKSDNLSGCRCCINDNDYNYMYPKMDLVCAPVFTPFGENGNLNLNVIDSYAAYLNSTGINCVVVTSAFGETSELTLAERKAVADKWLSLNKKYCFIIYAQVGLEAETDIISYTRYLVKNKIAAIIVEAQIYFKPQTVDNLVAYIGRVAGAAYPVPVIYYDDPNNVLNLNIRKIVNKTVNTIENIGGFRLSFPNAVRVRDLVPKDVTIYTDGAYIAAETLMGFTSRISRIANMFHKTMLDIRNSVVSKNLNKARVLQNQLWCLIENIKDQGLEAIPLLKATMEMISGVQVGPVRNPLPTANATRRQAICNILTDAGYTCNM